MFRKLRNKFILINMLTTTAILVIAFVSIFAFMAAGNRREKPHAPEDFLESSKMMEVFEKEIESERENQIVRLGVTLVLVGISVEALVFIMSYILAERSIRPVREAYIRQREFIANASHELKTPIAAVQANFEALGAAEQPWSDNIETELTRASKLVNDLLTLARTDGRTAAAKKDVDLVKIVKKRAQLIEARMGERELKLELPERVLAHLAEADYTQILDIFLDNAAKYAKSYVTVKMSGRTLIVENDGKTIPVEKLNKLFERFYQVDKTTEGSGLGLAIAKAVAEQNNWKIWAESEGGITQFYLTA
jgi:signal transduction histidine kinase